jgi:YegS/Rv2252/BmrU family lipid kinase
MKILFILNPVSGNRPADTEHFARCIQLNFPGADMRLTKSAGHATELAREAAAAGTDVVVAIGGDGTINETARGLVGTKTALAVVPRGSGNGFARELGMPLEFEEAVMRLQRGTISPCDIGRANGELFLNVAGVGLEAQIAWEFMEHGKNGARGKWPYFKLGAKTVFSYKPPVFDMIVDGKKTSAAPLTLVFANGRQYGSNFKIAPRANLGDGLLDMVAVKDAPKWKLALALPGFFTDGWRPFGITATHPVKNVILTREGNFPYHIDGEPRQASGKLEITVETHALNVLYPEK